MYNMYEENRKKTIKIVSYIAGGLVLLFLILILNPFVLINAGNRGVVLNWGAVSDNILGEGIHFRIPIMQKIKELEVRTVKMEVDAFAYSKDIQTVNTKIALNYHLKPDAVNHLYQEIGQDYRERIIDPAIQESVKAITAKFTAQDLIEKRAEVKDGIKNNLTERLTIKNIIVDDFSIVNFDFSDQYEKAVELKQVAQQDALKAENELKTVKIQAEQRVAQAMAEAQAIKIQAEAITQQGGKDYVDLKWVEAWKEGGAKVPETIIGSGGGNFLFNLSSRK